MFNRLGAAKTVALTGMVGLSLLLAMYNLVLPYLQGSPSFTFRSDNFWSYSSGFTRRGLGGEVIYRLDLLTGAGPEIFTALILVAFVLVMGAVAISLWREFSLLEIVLLGLSPVFVIFNVDGEVFMLLPLVYMALSRAPSRGVTLVLICAAILIREIALLIYAPVFLSWLIRGGWPVRAGVLAVLAIVLPLVLLVPSAPSYALETGYWQVERGFSLVGKGLYGFDKTSLGEVLAMHWGHIERGLVDGLPSLISFAALTATLIVMRTGSWLLAAWFVVTWMGAMVLTIDHGRYYYIFFAAAVLLSAPGARGAFADGMHAVLRRPDPVVPEQAPGGWVRPLRWRTLLLLAFMLAPTGFWVGGVSDSPRVVDVALYATGQKALPRDRIDAGG